MVLELRQSLVATRVESLHAKILNVLAMYSMYMYLVHVCTKFQFTKYPNSYYNMVTLRIQNPTNLDYY